MDVEARKEGSVLVVKSLNKRLDAHIAMEFKQKMSDYISRGNDLIVLDISEVEFIDSSGLGAIVSALKLLGGNGDLVIAGTRDSVMRMFKLTRMNKVFNMFDTEREAVDSLS
ncbi:MAG TPA: STAS domain-containing protein [Thermodesulfovibrionia bacterium]|nr:STAS domain-containing protein [Thermodesulfovibrionia bacterium]